MEQPTYSFAPFKRFFPWVCLLLGLQSALIIFWQVYEHQPEKHLKKLQLDSAAIALALKANFSELKADNEPRETTGEVKGFGSKFPDHANKGDMFLRVDHLPSKLYKFNGTNWIETDKDLTDQHVYDDDYIDHLIAKIGTGEYDPDLLSDAERDRIEYRLKNNTQN